jgi:methionyl-tRNA formyltransferase
VKSKVGSERFPGVPGAIVQGKGTLGVICGDGVLLEILEIQPANRKPVSGTAFQNGAHLRTDEKFEAVLDN